MVIVLLTGTIGCKGPGVIIRPGKHFVVVKVSCISRGSREAPPRDPCLEIAEV